MHVEAFIHNFLSSVIHKARVNVLVCILNALFKTKKLTLTSLGRALDLPIQERSCIRKLDRFLGNKFFQTKNICIYQRIIDVVIGAKNRPIIVVDWTKLPNNNVNVLRAALATEGRAITIYEEVHPKKDENNVKLQRCFLKKLKQMLPSECKPIIVSDAGFRAPWFRDILELNWDYVGRVLHSITCYSDGKKFRKITTLYKLATSTPKYLGHMILNKGNGIKTAFYIVKQKCKGRKDYRKSGKISTNKESRKYARTNSKPWLLVSSLTGTFAAKKVTGIYKRRMTIEENFRDMKSSQYGFGLRENKTLKVERLPVWLLLSSLASFIAWIVGNIAEKLNLQYQFQANSIKTKRVLSFFYLGCQVIKRKIPIDINNWDFDFRELIV